MKVVAFAAAALAAAAASASASAPRALVTFSHLAGQRGSANAAGGLCVAVGARSLRLTSAAYDDRSPAWSPNGRLLAFSRFRSVGEHNADVYVLDVARRRLRRITGQLAVFNSDPAWSPDGKQIAVAYSWHGGGLAILSPSGRLVRTLLDGSSYFGSPTWSPDGRTLAYDTSDGGGTTSVYRIPVAGGTPELVATNAWAPSWSRLGRLAFVRRQDGDLQVVTSNPDGSGVSVVADDVGTPQARPRWSPGGSLLAFVRPSNDLGSSVVEVANADGSGEHEVAKGALEPTWRPAAPLPRRRFAAC
jgi:TolB protein